jgi:uncharacterized damage-inducible protein DinB
VHEEMHVESLEEVDFGVLLGKSAATERVPRSRAEIIELLRVEGERAVQWVEARSEAFLSERVRLPGGGSVSRFEMLLATKEHELQHRAQITVMERMLGIVPRLTGLA